MGISKLKTKAAGIAAALTVAALGLGGGSAFAWTYGLSGSGACQSDGSYKITWVIDNSVENETLNITASSDNAVVPVGSTVAAHATSSFYQTVSGSSPADFSLSVTGNFPSDQTLRVKDATVILDTPCTQPGGMGGGPQSVTLCHATDSRTNPYVKITVDVEGAYNGHYSEHQGPVFSGSVTDKWGDIIPTFTYNDHSYSLNWDSAGQTIYNNDCNVGGMGGGPTTTSSGTPKVLAANTTTAQVAVVPQGSVNGGEGAASKTTNPVALVGLLGSLAGVGSGLSLLKRRAL